MKTMHLIIVFAGALLALTAYFLFFSNSFDAGLRELRLIEEKIGVKENVLLPATKNDLAFYKSNLLLFKKKWADSTAFSQLVEVKISLAKAGEKVFFVTDEFEKINKISPNCSPLGEIELLKIKANEAKKEFESTLNKRNNYVRIDPAMAQKTSEVSNNSFEQTLNGIQVSLDKIIEILDIQCRFRS